MATTFFPTMHLDWRKGGVGGLEREGALLKEDGGAVDQPGVGREGRWGGGLLCCKVAPLHARTHAFAFFFSLSLSFLPSFDFTERLCPFVHGAVRCRVTAGVNTASSAPPPTPTGSDN